jgi:hypothetical protein
MLIAVIVVLIVGLFLLTGGGGALNRTQGLGSMSDHWLGRYRATHTS